MASLLQILIISVSLAIDALGVSIAGGIRSKKTHIKDAVYVAAYFGFFQALMPLIGWVIGGVLSNFITTYADFVAFILLTIIGIKMIRDSLHPEESTSKNILDKKILVILSIATSIDALIVGITLGILSIPLLLSISIIGIVTFILCFLGYLFGKRLGTLFGRRIESIGGIALIGIGIKMLLS